MEILSLLVVALMPILKVLLITAVGLALATDRIKLLGPSARNHLNNLVFYVFSPALIGSNLADTVSVSSLRTLWFMLVNMLLCFVIGSILGWILVKITRTPQHLRGLVIGSASAGNTGNLLLIILPELCEESDSPFGDSTTCSTNAEAYASFSMAILAVYVWSYVYIIMRASANSGEAELNGGDESTISLDIPAEALEDSFLEPLLVVEDHRSAHNSAASLDLSHKMSFMEKFYAFTVKWNLKMIFSPATISAMIGLFIALISPLRYLMIGDSAPLRVIYSATSFVGEAAVPCITLIVGANLLKGIKGAGGSVSGFTIVGLIVVRFILLPPIGIVVVKGAQRLGLVGTNSLYLFTLMLQFSAPPAMNIGTISQLLRRGQSECSVIMLWTYLVSMFFLTFWCTFYLWLVA